MFRKTCDLPSIFTNVLHAAHVQFPVCKRLMRDLEILNFKTKIFYLFNRFLCFIFSPFLNFVLIADPTYYIAAAFTVKSAAWFVFSVIQLDASVLQCDRSITFVCHLKTLLCQRLSIVFVSFEFAQEQKPISLPLPRKRKHHIIGFLFTKDLLCLCILFVVSLSRGETKPKFSHEPS